MKKIVTILFLLNYANAQIAVHGIASKIVLDTSTYKYARAVNNAGYTFKRDTLRFVDTLIKDLRGATNPRYTTANYWAVSDVLEPLTWRNATACAINLFDTTTKSTFYNSPTFYNNGVQLNGTSQYILTNMSNFSTYIGANKYAQLGVYVQSKTTSSGSQYEFGTYDGGSNYVYMDVKRSNTNTWVSWANAPGNATDNDGIYGLYQMKSYSNTNTINVRKNKTDFGGGGNTFSNPTSKMVFGASGTATISNYSTGRYSFIYNSNKNTGQPVDDIFFNIIQAFHQRLGIAASGSPLAY